jgi:hypothetical protein
MISNEDFGSSLFKLQGEEATPADTLSVLSSIVLNPETREKCGGFSRFSRDLPIQRRHDFAESMVAVYLAVHAPPEGGRMSCTCAASPAFVSRCCPPPFSRWKNHIEGRYDKRGKASSAIIRSDTVYSVLTAIEQLWAVPGHLVKAQ